MLRSALVNRMGLPLTLVLIYNTRPLNDRGLIKDCVYGRLTGRPTTLLRSYLLPLSLVLGLELRPIGKGQMNLNIDMVPTIVFWRCKRITPVCQMSGHHLALNDHILNY